MAGLASALANGNDEFFFDRFGREPRYDGRTVLDLGSGLGGLSIRAARYGATVTAVDTDPVVVDWAKSHVFELHPEVAGRLTYTTGPIDRVGGCFDLVLSKDAFEHIADPAATLRALKPRLKSGGEIWIGFSPLYFSPWGGHGAFAYRIPWLQALPWPLARRLAQRAFNHEIRTRSDVWLNGLTPAEFRAYVADAGFRFRQIAYNSGDKRGLRVMSLLRRGPLERFMTVSIYAVLVHQD